MVDVRGERKSRGKGRANTKRGYIISLWKHTMSQANLLKKLRNSRSCGKERKGDTER